MNWHNPLDVRTKKTLLLEYRNQWSPLMEFNQKEMNVIGYSVETALSFLEGETEEFKSEHQSLINQLQVLINKIDW